MQEDELRANCKMWKDECLELREQLASARDILNRLIMTGWQDKEVEQWLKENE